MCDLIDSSFSAIYSLLPFIISWGYSIDVPECGNYDVVQELLVQWSIRGLCEVGLAKESAVNGFVYFILDSGVLLSFVKLCFMFSPFILG